MATHFIISWPNPESNARFWHRQRCWHSKGNGSKPISVTLWWLRSAFPMVAITRFMFLQIKMSPLKSTSECGMTTKWRWRRLNSRSMHSVSGKGIFMPAINGPSSTWTGWKSWFSRICIVKRWMSTWHPMRSRQQRLSGLIRGLRSWRKIRIIRRMSKNSVVYLESKYIPHCLWLLKLATSSASGKEIPMLLFLDLRRENLQVVKKSTAPESLKPETVICAHFSLRLQGECAEGELDISQRCSVPDRMEILQKS